MAKTVADVARQRLLVQRREVDLALAELAKKTHSKKMAARIRAAGRAKGYLMAAAGRMVCSGLVKEIYYQMRPASEEQNIFLRKVLIEVVSLAIRDAFCLPEDNLDRRSAILFIEGGMLAKYVYMCGGDGEWAQERVMRKLSQQPPPSSVGACS